MQRLRKELLNVRNKCESLGCSKLGKCVALCRHLQVIHLEVGSKKHCVPMHKAQTMKRTYFVLFKITTVLIGQRPCTGNGVLELELELGLGVPNPSQLCIQ